ncbi:MAG: c-type cytochrome, partial [Planctomycetes bacterium]|nr:c-type cytochrome [Planctomycetota bacterium]
QYTIYFDSPKEKGAYPFACSFPGHWQVMRGTLHVLEEGDELPLEPQLETPRREFVKEWKLEDLAADAAQLQGRSYTRGLEMFRVASCGKCHRLNCQGEKLGPDLTDVSKRFAGAKLLQQILEPSSEINKQYQTHLITTDTGKVFTGLLAKEDAESLHLLPNPLQPEQITILPKNNIDETNVSSQSTMPTGLLMTLSREEILDLLALLEAGGDPRHEYFRP